MNLPEAIAVFEAGAAVALPPVGEAHVWGIPLAAPPRSPDLLLPLLTTAERERAQRFRFEEDRYRAIIGRGMLRVILGGCTGQAPGSVELVEGPQGKPGLLGGGPDIQFNVAHSGAWILIGLCVGARIGVDVEQIRPLSDLDSVVGRHFSRGEMRAIRSLPAAERTTAFFDCWTRKEAYVKAVGAGLHLELDSFEVECRPGRAPAMLSIAGAEEPARWLLWSAAPSCGYSAAVATEAWSVSPWYWRKGEGPVAWLD